MVRDMSFRDLPLEECLLQAATREQRDEYELVRHARQPKLFSFDARLMGASEAYRRKDELEFEMWESVLPKLVSGAWRAVGRWNDEPSLRPIDPRLWQTLELNEMSFRYNRVWSGAGSSAFSDILVSQAEPGRRTGEHVGKKDLKKRLERWLQTKVAANEAPRTEADWYALAVEEEFSRQELSKNFFRGVWRALKQPHPLKFSHRPPT